MEHEPLLIARPTRFESSKQKFRNLPKNIRDVTTHLLFKTKQRGKRCLALLDVTVLAQTAQMIAHKHPGHDSEA